MQIHEVSTIPYSEELKKWAKTYFNKNKEILLLFNIHNHNQLIERILAIPKTSDPLTTAQ
jgi:hypothetical protein